MHYKSAEFRLSADKVNNVVERQLICRSWASVTSLQMSLLCAQC